MWLKKMAWRTTAKTTPISADGDCATGCNGRWITMARQLCTNNEINPTAFGAALYTCLKDGRQKGNNIMIHGIANCGKTFILNPVLTVFNCFANPAHNRYGWVGAEVAECIFLNDFRYRHTLCSIFP